MQTWAVQKLLDNVLVTSFLILSNFFAFEKLFEFVVVSTNSAKLKSNLSVSVGLPRIFYKAQGNYFVGQFFVG